MKNALVLVDHLGDDGIVTTGRILKDLTMKRFEQLEKRNLVREATAKEVQEGYKPPFTPEAKVAAEPDNKAAPAPPNKAAPAPASKAS